MATRERKLEQKHREATLQDYLATVQKAGEDGERAMDEAESEREEQHFLDELSSRTSLAEGQARRKKHNTVWWDAVDYAQDINWQDIK